MRSTIAALVLLASQLPAQSIASRVASAGDGTIRLTFAAKEGVCGNGRNVINHSSRGGDVDWECDEGPVRVVMTVSGGEIQSVRTYVGGTWRQPTGRVTDLGTVGAVEASQYLLGIAARASSKPAKDAILAATLADSAEVWPQLLAIARNNNRPTEVRKSAVFWLGQAAGEKATSKLDSVATDVNGDREVREQAIFALSQRPRNEGIPALIRIARTSNDPKLKKSALFWLGQSGDDRAVALFEELLLRK
jgi:hypothetical protein